MANTFIRPILSGIITIIIILLVSSFILSILVHFTSVSERSVEWLMLPLTMLTLFIGGMMAGSKSGEKGWYVGGLTGLIFVVISWLLTFLGFNTAIELQQFLLYLGYLVLATLGGMFGVNLSSQRKY